VPQDNAARECFVRLLLVLGVTLGSLVDLSGVDTPERVFVLLVMLAGVAAAMPGGTPKVTGARAMALWLFVTLTAVSYVRFGLAPIAPFTSRSIYGLAAMLVLATGFAYCALLAPMSPALQRTRRRCALFGPVVFTEVNLLLYVGGFKLPTDATQGTTTANPAEILGWLGIHANRVSFPLSPGVNGAGVAAAVSLVICVLLTRGAQRSTCRWPLAGAVASLAVILLADSRGALVFAILAVVLSSIHVRRAAARVLPVTLVFAPAIILFVVGHLGSLTPTLSRTPGDFVTATGRETIWDNVVRFLSQAHVQDLFGYGAYGQTRTGIGWQDAYLFPGQQYPEFFSVHSLALQTILDSGWIGLGVLVWFLSVALSAALRADWERRTPESVALLGALMMLVLGGSDEALPGVAGFYLMISLVTLGTAAMCASMVNARLPEWRTAHVLPVVASSHVVPNARSVARSR
jgi:hypothetical protein